MIICVNSVVHILLIVFVVLCVCMLVVVFLGFGWYIRLFGCGIWFKLWLAIVVFCFGILLLADCCDGAVWFAFNAV